ncbi:hypothetical protein PMAYCL1PPCAC_13011 [Pristionchus mayeri]|uniref:Uncharacterized protein n=1 Tax=Pristionchus mayeri TaxID=1317129 RepID=A0AAN5CH70_9BILA|nr:hypothetical protein PMAYCL1PPCAC_13011 [Pristionchus mayeri]
MLFFLLLFISSSLSTPFTHQRDLIKRDVVFREINGESMECQWYGTSPFCVGECPDDLIEVEQRSRLYMDNECPKKAGLFDYCAEDPLFGLRCLSGKKSLCCSRIW